MMTALILTAVRLVQKIKGGKKSQYSRREEGTVLGFSLR